MAQVVKAIASGVDDGRPKLLALLKDPTITQIVVEHKDRLTRFGFRYKEDVANFAQQWLNSAPGAPFAGLTSQR